MNASTLYPLDTVPLFIHPSIHLSTHPSTGLSLCSSTLATLPGYMFSQRHTKDRADPGLS